MTRSLDHHDLTESLADKARFQPPSNLTIPPRSRSLPTPVKPPNAEKWNTKDLPWRIVTDVTAAACASALVSPLITIIDR